MSIIILENPSIRRPFQIPNEGRPSHRSIDKTNACATRVIVENEASFNYQPLQDREIEAVDLTLPRSGKLWFVAKIITNILSVIPALLMGAFMIVFGSCVSQNALARGEKAVRVYQDLLFPLYTAITACMTNPPLPKITSPILTGFEFPNPGPIYGQKEPEFSLVGNPVLEIRKKIEEGLYKKLDPNSEEFQLLVKKYGEQRIFQAMQKIESRINLLGVFRSCRNNAIIKSPIALITQALESDSFLGTPILTFDRDNLPIFTWMNDHRSEKDKPFLLTPNSRCIRDNFEHERRFQNKEEMNSLFSHLKKQTPVQYLDDGCVARANWLAQVLQVGLKYEIQRVTISTTTGANFYSNHLPNINWVRHDVPVVLMQDGSKYVFDLSLPFPMELNKWLRNFCAAAANEHLEQRWHKNPVEDEWTGSSSFAKAAISMYEQFLLEHTLTEAQFRNRPTLISSTY